MAVSNAFWSLRCVSVFSFLFLFCVSANAQRDDWHMVSRDLFVKSSFAHGYMHGYEEGFHSGDLDMQMGRNYRDVKTHDRYKKPIGYRSQFGDHSLFDDGYHYGYLVGYVDCFSGRNFRAVQLVRGHAAIRPDTRSDQNFDRAFREGYVSGQRQGLKDGRSSENLGNPPFQCDEAALQSKGGDGEPKASYCQAFTSGYQLGYSDGFANQKEHGEIFARK
jgi:flagellar biosynthesis/type III secretory pathway protein FliH